MRFTKMIAAVAAITSLSFGSAASATPPDNASPNAAIFHEFDFCVINVDNDDIVVFGFGTEFTALETSGNTALLKCKADFLFTPPPERLVNTNVECGWVFQDGSFKQGTGRMRVTPDNVAETVCTINPGSTNALEFRTP